MLPAVHAVPPFATASARHISPEGCQLVIESSLLEKGLRLVMAMSGFARVTGTVRWVVGDRVGFAFDAPIAGEFMQAMKLGPHGPGLELYRV
ncbi:PilZ domain-containing protein [Novosphingobium clariflavum]|uniref:PilZ domain-containing protein n=1 Tax=Novosphingobium clariflavum TaxID=2029884 RepID=A0ABV6S6E6_9SPHN|nr:PilZ domain-containing protein [Novosphingobium clariflavum]